MTRPAWCRVFEQVPEASCEVETLSGRVPEGLAGTLYRNGGVHTPDVAHLFDGDGMVRAVRFRPGERVRYQSRFLDTPARRARRAGRPWIGVGFGTRERRLWPRAPADVMTMSNQGNTNVLGLDRRLYALWEAGKPYEIDPHTLENLGARDFGGAVTLKQPFSAHPRIDPRTGECWNFGMYYRREPGIRVFCLDARGRMKAHRDVTLPVSVLNHDFALTERWAVFLLSSLRLTPAGILISLGLRTVDECVIWDSRAPALVVLVPRDGGAVRMFEIEPLVNFHFAGAQEDGDELVVDLTEQPDPLWFSRALRAYRAARWEHVYGRLTRVRLHVPSEKLLSREVVADFTTEFPQVDARGGLSSYRHVFAALTPRGAQGLQRGLGWFRPADRSCDVYDFGEGCVVSEPVYVPRRADAPEGDGWLIALVHDPRHEGSRVVILDSLEPSRGPVYVGGIPVNAGFTFHGCWRGESP